VAAGLRRDSRRFAARQPRRERPPAARGVVPRAPGASAARSAPETPCATTRFVAWPGVQRSQLQVHTEAVTWATGRWVAPQPGGSIRRLWCGLAPGRAWSGPRGGVPRQRSVASGCCARWARASPAGSDACAEAYPPKAEGRIMRPCVRSKRAAQPSRSATARGGTSTDSASAPARGCGLGT